MLTRLAVCNLVVIPELEITFAPGLTVISGESGAGKPVLIEALNLALVKPISGSGARQPMWSGECCGVSRNARR